jgi:hypothetical protein
MSYPGIPHIRVGYMAPRLPYPVSVYLPPTSGHDTRQQIRTSGRELDISIPQDPARHAKLGRFLNAWGSLESTLDMFLTYLTPLELRDATLFFPKLGMRNAIELLEGLNRRKLAPESADAFTNLLDRVGRLVTKRNILVHGQWVLEANVLVRRGEAFLVTQFLREVIPTNPKEAEAMGNPRNQKERVRYSFTLKRIDAATRDTDAVNIDLTKFSESMKRKTLPPSEIPNELLRAKPYRVTHSTP